MLKMSFYTGTLDREELVDFVQRTDKPIKYTYGFSYKNPTIYRKLIDKKHALKIIETEGYLDADELEDYLHLNAYSENDMF